MGAVQLHAVESGRDGAPRGQAELLDDAGQFLVAQPARGLVGLLAVRRVDEPLNRPLAAADGLHTAVEAGMRRSAGVPDLQHDAPAGGVHRVGHLAPAGHAGLVVDAGLAGEGTALTRHHGGLGDQQAGTGALRVVLGHQRVGDMAAPGARARQRRHDDAVGQGLAADLQRREERTQGKGSQRQGTPADGAAWRSFKAALASRDRQRSAPASISFPHRR
jgi:hypothetical protein